jgi:hypothetical protein
MATTGQPVATHQGGEGYARTNQSELFMLVSSFMGGDANFYESQDERYKRLVTLSNICAVDDPTWFYDLVNWTRNDAKMRTAAGVMAVEGVRGRLQYARIHGEKVNTSQDSLNRNIINVACSRADEPGEILAYYSSNYGKNFPRAIRLGVGDAATRLYTERSYLRNGAGNNVSYSFQDVLRLTHPKPKDPFQDTLFSYILGKFDHEIDNAYLPKIMAREALYKIPQDKRREALMAYASAKYDTHLADAEMDHMTMPAWLGSMDKAAWEACIPNMGVMAMLMNLRNFDKVGISDGARQLVMAKISDPEEVAKSKVLPMRFLSAYRNAPSVSWHWPIEQGINHTLSQIPELKGNTLVMIDMSGSMSFGKISDKSQLTYADAAKIFGAVLKARNPHVDLVQYGTHAESIVVDPGTSVVKIMERFRAMGGTNTNQVLRRITDQYRFKRVIIVTDEQAMAGRNVYSGAFGYQSEGPVGEFLPNDTMLYTWNLAGYAPAHTSGGLGNKHHLGGGFSDAAFSIFDQIESRGNGKWPWEK